MFGFACQENVVLTAAAGTKAFGERIRNGVLWKDSFALGHGEFAHSYQWLVAGSVEDGSGQDRRRVVWEPAEGYSGFKAGATGALLRSPEDESGKEDCPR